MISSRQSHPQDAERKSRNPNGGDMKNTILAITTLSLFAASIMAAPGYNYPPTQMQPSAYQQVGPDALLREGMTKLLGFLRTAQNPQPQQISAFLEREVAPYFDFDYMATWAAGPMNRQMNDQQRQAFGQKIKQLLLGTLAKRLTSYDNQDVRFFRPRRVGENEVKVRVGILQAGGYPTSLDFRFYLSDTGWKVFDVSANGTSALAYYRRHFADQMRSRNAARAYRR
jgi:phospholipid transport system substrate-binding protein